MGNVITIFRKEVATFFNSLVGYIVLGAFVVLGGLFFWVFDGGALTSGLANMDMLFGSAPYLFLFLVPAITMGSFSEENSNGTIETLMTKPVTDWQVILGKYLSAAFVVLVALLPTFIYYMTIADLAEDPGNLASIQTQGNFLRDMGGPTYTSSLDHGPIIGAYIGLFCLGLIFVAVGILASALSRNQVVAFIIASLGSFILFDGLTFFSEVEALQGVGVTIARLGISAHFESISKGLVDTRDVIYFLSAISIFLISTRLVLTLKRR